MEELFGDNTVRVWSCRPASEKCALLALVVCANVLDLERYLDLRQHAEPSAILCDSPHRDIPEVATVARDSSSDRIYPQRLAAFGFTPACADSVTQKLEPKKDRKEWKRQLQRSVCFKDDINAALESGMRNIFIPCVDTVLQHDFVCVCEFTSMCIVVQVMMIVRSRQRFHHVLYQCSGLWVMTTPRFPACKAHCTCLCFCLRCLGCAWYWDEYRDFRCCDILVHST